MLLKKLLKCLSEYSLKGSLNSEIASITEDSRKVVNKSLFVAIKGIRKDGHSFIAEAIENGAKVVVVEKMPVKKKRGVTYIKVRNSRKSLGLLAAEFYRNPSTKIKVIGVTGTDGKTTTAALIHHILETSAKKCGLITTIAAKIDGKEIDTGLHVTSPDAVKVQSLINEMVEKKCEYAVVEVTSHALDQERFFGIYFDCAVLTNITHEHLDYHKDFTSYREAKMKLFENALSYVVINKDDPSYEYILKRVTKSTDILFYSLSDKDVTIYAHNLNILETENNFEVIEGVNSYILTSNLPGEYNVSNILAAITCVRAYGIDYDSIKKALSTFKAPKGRLEEIKNQRGYKIYVDFAHTPNSLEKVLTYLRMRLVSENPNGKLIAVFGCAGERDELKRPLMGEISTNIADISIFTTEDPRSEDVNKIISQMEKGTLKTVSKNIGINNYHATVRGSNVNNKTRNYYFIIPERGEAIAFAIQKLARKGDIVVVCGKGHEQSMAYNSVEYDWSDEEAVKLALKGDVKEITRSN